MKSIKTFFFLVFISSCGVISKIENNIIMEDPARRRIMDAVMELKSSQEINFTDINFFRLKGNGQITLGKKEYKTRLDFRIQEKGLQKLWLDISDPFIGMKLARLIINSNGLQAYANVVNKYVDIPISRIEELNIPVNTNDIVSVVQGNAIEWPENLLTANMDFTSEIWSLNFPVKRNKFHGEMTLRFSAEYDHQLLSQKIEFAKESVTMEINYQKNGSWNVQINSPQGGCQIKFSIRSKKTFEYLKFPFNIPSDYARIDF